MDNVWGQAYCLTPNILSLAFAMKHRKGTCFAAGALRFIIEPDLYGITDQPAPAEREP